MNINHNSKEYEEYLRWYNGVLASIASVSAEISQYNALKSAVSNLKSDLTGYSTHFKNIYTYARNGISSPILDPHIDKISEYANEAENMILDVEDVIGDINLKLDKLNQELRNLKASIGR